MLTFTDSFLFFLYVLNSHKETKHQFLQNTFMNFTQRKIVDAKQHSVMHHTSLKGQRLPIVKESCNYTYGFDILNIEIPS